MNSTTAVIFGALSGALALLVNTACTTATTDPAKNVQVEVVLSDKNIPQVTDARVIVLPSGERVLVLTGPEGLATCCLLPPLSAPKVEKP